MLIILVPALFAIIGLFMIFSQSTPPTRWFEIGKITYLCGLLVTLFVVATHYFKV